MATEPHRCIAAKGGGLPLHEGEAAFSRPPNFLWLCIYVAMWLRSYVAMWLHGYATMWLCGYAMWQKSSVACFLKGWQTQKTQKQPYSLVGDRTDICSTHWDKCSSAFSDFWSSFPQFVVEIPWNSWSIFSQSTGLIERHMVLDLDVPSGNWSWHFF